jgi:hypothetical protein
MDRPSDLTLRLRIMGAVENKLHFLGGHLSVERERPRAA